ncbi:MAG TPA: pitrilysin family protein, partial [Gemmatimonadaceae bacterium]|nr:pitrilysin family protein [Gemmatimonadaceae bacterium]
MVGVSSNLEPAHIDRVAREVVMERALIGGALIEPDSVVRATLANGLTVLVRRDASAPVVAIVTFVSAGYFDETDDVVGIAHVLEHMYFKGTTTRGVGEIAKQTKAAGGYLNAATIYDHTSYYTVLPASSVGSGLEIQADAYANSLVDAEELRRELEVIIQEAKRKADNPGAVATESLYELLHDSHRIRRWRIGREPGLRALTRAALVGFYRTFYHPSNTVLSIVGDVDPDAVLKQVEQCYGALPSGVPVRTPGAQEAGAHGFRYREWGGDIGQVQLALGWRTPGTLHPDTPALDLLADVLGTGRASRLYRGVRERALASSISAYNYTPTELGVFVIHAEAKADATVDAARAVWDQVHRVRDGAVGALEVERAKRIFEARWVRHLEDMEGQAMYLAQWQALGDWRLGDQYLERYLGTTADDASRAARSWLDPDETATIVYRPEGIPPICADAAAWRGQLDGGHVAPLEPAAPNVAAAPITPRPRPTFEREESGVRVYRTANGIPVLVRPKAGAHLIHVGAFANGGARDEAPETAGRTALMVRTAVKGTARRSTTQIAEDSELLGGSVRAATGSETFGWSISVPAVRAAAAIELLSDVVQHPVFGADATATERSAARAEVIALRDDMHRYPAQLAVATAFDGHPYGVPVGGTAESLAETDEEDLRRWYQARVRRAPMAIVVVGGGDPEELARLASQAFGELEFTAQEAIAPPVWPVGVLTSAEVRERAQTALALLFPGPSRVDPDRFAAGMIAGVASGLG